MKQSWFKSLVFATAMCMTLPAFAADTIRIGVQGAHSGDLAGYGMPSLNAFRLVAKEYNEAGGLLGKQIELIPQDDQCKPEVATNAATKLISDKVAMVLGPTCSGATKASLPIYKEANMIVISPSATTPALTQSGEYPTFFRTIAADNDQAALGVDFIINKLGAKKVAILHDKGDYGKSYAGFVRDYLKDKADVVLFEGITPGAVDYSPIIQKVRGADVLVFGGYHPEAAKLVQQMRMKRISIPFVSEDGVKTETFLQVAGKDAEGVYASSAKDVSALPLYKKATEQHQKEFGTETGNFYMQAYSAAKTMFEAIKAAGSTDADKVMAALRNNMVDTPLGTFKYNNKGDAEGVGFSMYQVQNGQFVEVK